MSRILIAIGGTGQMVLHYYVQLWLTGAILDSFDAYVFDSDSSIASLAFLKVFLDDVREAVGSEHENVSVPSIRLVSLKQGAAGGNVCQMLTQHEAPGQRGFQSEAQAFFSRETLMQDVRAGLFARPALSAVMALRPALDALDPLRLPKDSTIVLVCSCIGGTGAGLAIPLLWRLANAPYVSLKLRAVLLGEFFQPREAATVGRDIERFRSNRLAFLKALQESVPQLHQFSFCEEPKMAARDPQKEQAADHLPWPQTDEPYWQAVSAVEYLFRERVAAVQGDFHQRQVPRELSNKAIDRNSSWQQMEQALGRVDALIRHRIFRRLHWEASAHSVWGSQITEMLVAYYRLFLQAGSRIEPGDFLKRLQSEVERLWTGWGAAQALSRVFPHCKPQQPSLQNLRDMPWPAPPAGLNPGPFRDPAAGFRRLAAVVLTMALRRTPFT